MLALISNALMAFVKIATWIEALVSFLMARQAAIDKRLKDAEAAEEQAKKVAKEQQSRKERANVEAFKLASEQSLKFKYEKILSILSAGKPEEILAMINVEDLEVANDLIFHKEYSNEYKSLQLVRLMTPIA